MTLRPLRIGRPCADSEGLVIAGSRSALSGPAIRRWVPAALADTFGGQGPDTERPSD